MITDLDLKYIDGRRWRLLRPLYYVGTREVTVPAGFETDFASIPRLIWRVLPPAGDGRHGAYGKAAVVHDFLYKMQTTTRAEADAVFFEAMQDVRVSWWRRWVIYLAVRAFGWVPWCRYPPVRDAQ